MENEDACNHAGRLETERRPRWDNIYKTSSGDVVLTSRFGEITSKLRSGAVCGRILAALQASSVTDTDELMDIVRGRNIDQATALLKEELSLSKLDASALAGVLLESSGPSASLRNAVVYFGLQSEKFKGIVSFNDLICKLQVVPKWKKTLRYSDFSLCGEFGKEDLRDVISDTTLAAVPVTTANGEMKIILKLNSKEFSKFKYSQEEALSSIGSVCNRLEYIPRYNYFFPQVVWSENLSEVDFNAIISRVAEDIMYRNEVIDRDLASEYTMREFIGPILVGALRLVLIFLEKTGNPGRLSLICEKIIVGLHAHGPVDYVVVFDYLNIIITEAKKLEIFQGVIQNLLQQRASQEFQTNALLDPEETGESRKRSFQDAFEEIASTATCGCATTGSKWIFTKIRYNNESKRSVVEMSETYTIDLGRSKEDLQQAIKPILSIFVRITMDQIDVVANNTRLSDRHQRTLSVFNLQAEEGNAVENEINESKVADEENSDDYYESQVADEENSDDYCWR